MHRAAPRLSQPYSHVPRGVNRYETVNPIKHEKAAPPKTRRRSPQGFGNLDHFVDDSGDYQPSESSSDEEYEEPKPKSKKDTASKIFDSFSTAVQPSKMMMPNAWPFEISKHLPTDGIEKTAERHGSSYSVTKAGTHKITFTHTVTYSVAKPRSSKQSTKRITSSERQKAARRQHSSATAVPKREGHPRFEEIID